MSQRHSGYCLFRLVPFTLSKLSRLLFIRPLIALDTLRLIVYSLERTIESFDKNLTDSDGLNQQSTFEPSAFLNCFLCWFATAQVSCPLFASLCLAAACCTLTLPESAVQIKGDGKSPQQREQKGEQ